MSVKEIEIAITRLPATELGELMAWFENYAAQMWEKQIEEDLRAGRLDAVLAEVDQEYGANAGIGAGAAIWPSPLGCYAGHRRTGEKRGDCQVLTELCKGGQHA